MNNRKENSVQEILDFILERFDLTIPEEDLTESFLEILRERKIEKQNQLTHLLNDETEELLKLLNDREVLDYAIDLGDFIASDDEDGLEESLDDLKFNWIEKVADVDMIKSLEDDGWNVTMDNVYPRHQDDIVTQSDLEEMTDLFLSADFNKRDEILKQLKV